MGLKIGTDDTPRYIVMETHYDNPDQRTGEATFNSDHGQSTVTAIPY